MNKPSNFSDLYQGFVSAPDGTDLFSGAEQTDRDNEHSAKSTQTTGCLSIEMAHQIWKLQKDLECYSIRKIDLNVLQHEANDQSVDGSPESSPENELPFWVRFPIFELHVNSLMADPAPVYPELLEETAASSSETVAEKTGNIEPEKTEEKSNNSSSSGSSQINENSRAYDPSAALRKQKTTTPKLAGSASKVQTQRRSAQNNKRPFDSVFFRTVFQQLFASVFKNLSGVEHSEDATDKAKSMPGAPASRKQSLKQLPELSELPDFPEQISAPETLSNKVNPALTISQDSAESFSEKTEQAEAEDQFHLPDLPVNREDSAVNTAKRSDSTGGSENGEGNTASAEEDILKESSAQDVQSEDKRPLAESAEPAEDFSFVPNEKAFEKGDEPYNDSFSSGSHTGIIATAQDDSMSDQTVLEVKSELSDQRNREDAVPRESEDLADLLQDKPKATSLETDLISESDKTQLDEAVKTGERTTDESFAEMSSLEKSGTDEENFSDQSSEISSKPLNEQTDQNTKEAAVLNRLESDDRLIEELLGGTEDSTILQKTENENSSISEMLSSSEDESETEEAKHKTEEDSGVESAEKASVAGHEDEPTIVSSQSEANLNVDSPNLLDSVHNDPTISPDASAADLMEQETSVFAGFCKEPEEQQTGQVFDSESDKSFDISQIEASSEGVNHSSDEMLMDSSIEATKEPVTHISTLDAGRGLCGSRLLDSAKLDLIHSSDFFAANLMQQKATGLADFRTAVDEQPDEEALDAENINTSSESSTEKPSEGSEPSSEEIPTASREIIPAVILSESDIDPDELNSSYSQIRTAVSMVYLDIKHLTSAVSESLAHSCLQTGGQQSSSLIDSETSDSPENSEDEIDSEEPLTGDSISTSTESGSSAESLETSPALEEDETGLIQDENSPESPDQTDSTDEKEEMPSFDETKKGLDEEVSVVVEEQEEEVSRTEQKTIQGNEPKEESFFESGLLRESDIEKDDSIPTSKSDGLTENEETIQEQLIKKKAIDTKKILGNYQADWVLLRPFPSDIGTAEEAIRQTDMRLHTKHHLGLDLLRIARSKGLVKEIHQIAEESVYQVMITEHTLEKRSQFERKEYLKKMNPGAIALSLSLIALDSDYRALSPDALHEYGLPSEKRNNLLKAMRFVSEYYGTDEPAAPTYYLRQCVITRGSRSSFAQLMFEIYSQILEKELPDNLEDVLGSIFSDYVKSVNEESIEENEFKVIYQTASLKELFVTPFWHPELIQYAALFLKYIDAVYWQKPTDGLPYEEEFGPFFAKWFENKNKKLERRSTSEPRQKASPKWKAYFKLVSDSSGSLKIFLTTKTFYLEPDQKVSAYRVAYFSGTNLLTTAKTLHCVIHLQARLLEPISVDLENPFSDISYSLFYRDELVYTSGTKMFRKWIFFDDDGNETTPENHLGETLWIALPAKVKLAGLEEYKNNSLIQIGRIEITQSLLLNLYEAANLFVNVRPAAAEPVEKFSAVLAGAPVPHACIQYGKKNFPIYSSIHGINCTGNEYSLSECILEVDHAHREIEYDLAPDKTGRYVKVVRLEDDLETGFHQIQIIPKKGNKAIASFKAFLDQEAPGDSYMVFNPKKKKYSYSNFTELHEEINEEIDLGKNHLISAEIEMPEFEDPLKVFYPTPLPFYRVGETGDWINVQIPLTLEQVESETRIYVDGVYSDEIEVVNDHRTLQKLPIIENEDHMRYFESSTLLNCVSQAPCSPALVFKTASNEKDHIYFSATTTARVLDCGITLDHQSLAITIDAEGPDPVRMKVMQKGREIFYAEDLFGTQRILVDNPIDYESCQIILEGYSDDLFAPFTDYQILHVKRSFRKYDTTGFICMRVDGVHTKGLDSRFSFVENMFILLPESYQEENGTDIVAYLTNSETPSLHEIVEVCLFQVSSTTQSGYSVATLSEEVSTARLVYNTKTKTVYLKEFSDIYKAKNNPFAVTQFSLGNLIIK